MSLTIKSQRIVALVRELAARTGTSQTAAEKTRRELDKLLTDEDKRTIVQNEAELFDDNGLPR